MRTRTFFLSFVVHVLLIGAAVVTRVVANDVLPEPPGATTFVIVTPEVPAVPPSVPPPRRPLPAAAGNQNAAPVVEPADIQPEVPRLLDDVPASGTLIGAAAGLPGSAAEDHAIAPPQPSPRGIIAPVRIGGDIRAPQKVQHVAPEYPALARSARVEGIVILEAIIAEDGTVRQVSVLRSEPLLDEAAVRAVRQWRFTPTLLNGQPVPVIMTVTVAFNLN